MKTLLEFLHSAAAVMDLPTVPPHVDPMCDVIEGKVGRIRDLKKSGAMRWFQLEGPWVRAVDKARARRTRTALNHVKRRARRHARKRLLREIQSGVVMFVHPGRAMSQSIRPSKIGLDEMAPPWKPRGFGKGKRHRYKKHRLYGALYGRHGESLTIIDECCNWPVGKADDRP